MDPQTNQHRRARESGKRTCAVAIGVGIFAALSGLCLRAEEKRGNVALGVRDAIAVPAPGGDGSILHHRDGRLMGFRADWTVCYSSDGGHRWTPPELVKAAEKDEYLYGVIRLKSGKLGLLGAYLNHYKPKGTRNFPVTRLRWTVSSDEGHTWSKPVLINWNGEPSLPALADTVIQTRTGRIIVPVYIFTRMLGARAEGLVKYHPPDFAYEFAYYSDDEGQTWWRSLGETFIWKDQGYGGIWAVDESSIVELRDGRILRFIRTALGQVYQCFSEDGGNLWSAPEPAGLAASGSPVRLKRIPKTGDLMCLWSQESAEEIRAGLSRERLEVALSRDEGKSWEYFKTIDTGGQVAPAGRIKPVEPQMLRARDDVAGDSVGLPYDYAGLQYPNVAFHEDQALIAYNKLYLPKNRKEKVWSSHFLILPLAWFYR